MTQFPISSLVAKISAAKEVADFQTSNILYAIALHQMFGGEHDANICVALGDNDGDDLLDDEDYAEDGTFAIDALSDIWLDGFYDVVFIRAGNSNTNCGIPAPLLSNAALTNICEDPTTRCYFRYGTTYDGRAFTKDYEAFNVIEAEGTSAIKAAWEDAKWVLDKELADELDNYLANGGLSNVA